MSYVYVMKVYRADRRIPHLYLPSALDRGERSTSHPGRFAPGVEPVDHRVGPDSRTEHITWICEGRPATCHASTVGWGIRGIALLFFLTSALGRGGWSKLRHAPVTLLPGKSRGIHCTGGWMGRRAEHEYANNYVKYNKKTESFYARFSRGLVRNLKRQS